MPRMGPHDSGVNHLIQYIFPASDESHLEIFTLAVRSNPGVTTLPSTTTPAPPPHRAACSNYAFMREVRHAFPLKSFQIQSPHPARARSITPAAHHELRQGTQPLLRPHLYSVRMKSSIPGGRSASTSGQLYLRRIHAARRCASRVQVEGLMVAAGTPNCCPIHSATFAQVAMSAASAMSVIAGTP
jgi:hypothetical protein